MLYHCNTSSAKEVVYIKNDEIKYLEIVAAKARLDALRMVKVSGHGHIGGAFSCIDLITALYFHTMNIDPKNPKMPERDRFLLSAAHKSLAQYAVLYEKGYFGQEVLDTYGHLCSPIPGHPDMHKLPGIEANTGALGHGLSIATGMALALRDSEPGARVFVILGDGELPEGSNWEAVMAAAHWKVDNLVVFCDLNGLQISGRTADVMNLEPVWQRFTGFGWNCVDLLDANDMTGIVKTLDNLPRGAKKPTVVLCRTMKGKGLSFAEDNVKYHFWKPSKEEFERARVELEKTLSEREAQ